MNTLRILFDGWSLTHAPNSAATLHLLAILAYLPQDIDPIIAYPEPPPAWAPDRAQAHLEPTPPNAHLRWEQQILPKLRQKLEAHLLHLMTETASLLNNTRTVISPTQSGNPTSSQPGSAPRGGLLTRLRAAVSAGGTARAQAILWPNDRPPHPNTLSLPPIVHPAFIPDPLTELDIPGLELPETYILYHGPDDPASLSRALEAWTWAATPLGDTHPLLFLGLTEAARAEAQTLADTLRLRDTIFILPTLPPGWIPALYRGASTVFHPAGEPPWGGVVRHALACGKPLVAAETAWASAIVGPAAVLVAPGDTRRLGGSVIGTIVKEELSARLQEAAIARATAWRDQNWGDKLREAYENVLG